MKKKHKEYLDYRIFVLHDFFTGTGFMLTERLIKKNLIYQTKVSQAFSFNWSNNGCIGLLFGDRTH